MRKRINKESILRNSIKILTLFILIIFLSAGTMIYSAQQSVTEIKEISYQKTKIDKIEIFLRIQGSVQHKIIDLDVPKQFAIEFSPIQNILIEPLLEIQDTQLLSIRVEKVQPEVARVVLDFAERFYSCKIIPVDLGFIIEFLFEEAAEIEQKPKKIKPAEAKPVKIEEKVQEVVSKEIPSRKADPNYYILVKTGFGKIIEPDIHAQDSFQLYGETGSLTEHYRLNSGFIVNVILGRYFTIKNVKFKGSLGFSSWSFKNDGNFQFSLPHPFISDSPRSLIFTENNSGSHRAIYVSPQVSVIKKNNFQIWAGPIIGYAKGNVQTLEDIGFSDNFPFTSSDISITSTSFEEKFSSLWWGISASVEYRFIRSLSLLLDINYIKLSPNSTNLNQKINLSRYQFFLGLQYKFL